MNLGMQCIDVNPFSIAGSIANHAIAGSRTTSNVLRCHGLRQKDHRQRRPPRPLQR